MTHPVTTAAQRPAAIRALLAPAFHEPQENDMSETPIRWMPDERSAQILAAFGSHKEKAPSVLRRALELLAQADGIVDTRGRIKTAPAARPAARRQP